MKRALSAPDVVLKKTFLSAQIIKTISVFKKLRLAGRQADRPFKTKLGLRNTAMPAKKRRRALTGLGDHNVSTLPQILIACPDMLRPRGEARKMAWSATSCALTMRRRDIFFM